MIGYRDHLLILFIYMLLVIYQYSHVEWQEILNILIPLLLKAASIFVDEYNTFVLLMSYINAEKVFSLKNENYEKSIIINSLKIIISEFY
jgi:hypothetical protein